MPCDKKCKNGKNNEVLVGNVIFNYTFWREFKVKNTRRITTLLEWGNETIFSAFV